MIQMDAASVLRGLPDDAARARYCLDQAAGCRDRYQQGKRETITDVLLSDSLQYAGMVASARVAAAKIRWSTSQTARQIVNDEVLFSRWAVMYSTRSMQESIAAQTAMMTAATRARDILASAGMWPL